jgi:hypothetical protein
VSLLPLDTLTFYLPFPDGVLQYVCAECDALCCRGHSFGGSLSREMGTLFVLYPALEGAVIARRGDIVTVRNPARACYFLTGDNRCGVEDQHGTPLKPAVCRLFPFNNFSRLSEDIVVLSPHFLCPLRVVLPRSDKVEGTHQKVIQAARDSFLLDRADFSANVAPVALASRQTPQGALQQEISFRDACSDALQAARFLDVLALSSSSPDSLKRFLHRAARVCGVEDAAPQGRDYLDDVLLALASSWRVKMLSLGHERMLRVLALGEVLIRRLASLSVRALTPQQVDQSYGEMFPACHLLSQEESPMILPKAHRKVPPFGTPELTFTAYQALRAAERNVLVAFEEAFPQNTPTHDRMAILIELGSHCAYASAQKRPRTPR